MTDKGSIGMKNYVVITEAEKMNFRNDYVALPQNYGTEEYFARKDVKAIYKAVYENLDELDSRLQFTEKLSSYRHVFVKPNLVSVYHNAGMEKVDYPESTDPRVFDAVIAYLHKYTNKIIIIESSGKPMPTKTSFHISGIDRIAKRYETGLIALETCSVVRYMVPKAEVMKEVYIPEILDEVVRGESYYISVPKLKTNVYTGVTLGFKNAMGTIPYFLRERNHNYYINKKLADLLYLFQPNLVIIDGIIGGEGNTPAPVDPVDVGVILSGDNAVAVDREGTKIMGIDPNKIPLILEAAARGFESDNVEVIGKKKPMQFRRANASLMADDFHNSFQNVLVLAGHNLPHAPKVKDIHSVTPELARKLEMACDGGCLAALRSGFDYVGYSTNPNYDFPLVIIIGGGILWEGKRYWFDREGKPYSEDDIRKMKDPIMTVGNCANGMDDCAKYKTPGCCSPSTCMLVATQAAGVTFPLLTWKNKSFLHFGYNILGVVWKRSILTAKGKWVDCPSEHVDKIYPILEVSDEEKQKDFIAWPLPKMDWKMRWKLIKNQLSILKM